MAELVSKTNEDIAAAYDSPSWWYDARGFCILKLAYRSTLREQIVFFGTNIKPRHLEVAIGSGSLYRFVERWRRWKSLPRPFMSGIDYAPAMLAGALHKYASDPNVDLKLADVANLPYPDDTFDSVNIANAIHCFPNVDAALAEVARVAKPGASVAINVLLYPRGPKVLRWPAESINVWGMKKGILVTPYEKDDIRARLLANGFEMVEERVRGNTYNVLVRAGPRL